MKNYGRVCSVTMAGLLLAGQLTMAGVTPAYAADSATDNSDTPAVVKDVEKQVEKLQKDGVTQDPKKPNTSGSEKSLEDLVKSINKALGTKDDKPITDTNATLDSLEGKIKDFIEKTKTDEPNLSGKDKTIEELAKSINTFLKSADKPKLDGHDSTLKDLAGKLNKLLKAELRDRKSVV